MHQQREMVHGVKSGRKQAQTSRCTVQWELHKTHLILPAMSSDSKCENVTNQLSSLETLCLGLLLQKWGG